MKRFTMAALICIATAFVVCGMARAQDEEKKKQIDDGQVMTAEGRETCTVTVSWQAKEGAQCRVTGFTWIYSEVDKTYHSQATDALSGEVEGTSFEMSGLKDGHVYCFQVSCDGGAPSPMECKLCTALAQIDLKILSANENEIRLGWSPVPERMTGELTYNLHWARQRGVMYLPLPKDRTCDQVGTCFRGVEVNAIQPFAHTSPEKDQLYCYVVEGIAMMKTEENVEMPIAVGLSNEVCMNTAKPEFTGGKVQVEQPDLTGGATSKKGLLNRLLDFLWTRYW